MGLLPHFFINGVFMIKRFQKVWFWLAILAAVVLVGSFLVSSLITRNAVFAQRVEVVAPEFAAVLGLPADSKGKTIGSPQWLIINDPKALLEKDANGVQLVSESYLRDNKIYPLQVITVEFFRNLVAAFAFVGLGLMLLLYRFAR
jgi:hypothetical protein